LGDGKKGYRGREWRAQELVTQARRHDGNLREVEIGENERDERPRDVMDPSIFQSVKVIEGQHNRSAMNESINDGQSRRRNNKGTGLVNIVVSSASISPRAKRNICRQSCERNMD
jgi:hypothetical protein